jgi:Na+/proline symporter
MGRLSGLALTGLGVAFAFYIDQVLQAFLFTETIAALMGVMFLGGFLWRRANRAGAVAATVVAFAVYYGLNHQATGEWALVYKWKPWPFAWAMLGGFGSLIVVSLLTRPEDPERIRRFFDRMNRSSDGDDAEGPEQAAAATAAERGQDLLLLDMPGWCTAARWRGFFRRYREDLVGFALAWGMVGLLLAMAWGLMQVGKP